MSSPRVWPKRTTDLLDAMPADPAGVIEWIGEVPIDRLEEHWPRMVLAAVVDAQFGARDLLCLLWAIQRRMRGLAVEPWAEPDRMGATVAALRQTSNTVPTNGQVASEPAKAPGRKRAPRRKLPSIAEMTGELIETASKMAPGEWMPMGPFLHGVPENRHEPIRAAFRVAGFELVRRDDLGPGRPYWVRKPGGQKGTA